MDIRPVLVDDHLLFHRRIVSPVCRAVALGMAGSHESVLPRLGSLHEARLGEPDDLSGVSWVLPWYFRHLRWLWRPAGFARSHRNRPGDRRLERAGRWLAIGCLFWRGKGFPRPVARRQPGFLARMVPIEAFEIDATGLGVVLGLRRGLDRDRGAKLESGITNVDNIATLNVFQVGVGLLLLSVSAVTSLAEERMRGSLDVFSPPPSRRARS